MTETVRRAYRVVEVERPAFGRPRVRAVEHERDGSTITFSVPIAEAEKYEQLMRAGELFCWPPAARTG